MVKPAAYNLTLITMDCVRYSRKAVLINYPDPDRNQTNNVSKRSNLFVNVLE